MRRGFVFLFLLLVFAACKNEDSAQKMYVQALEFYSERDFEKSLECLEACLKNCRSIYQADLLKAKIFYFENENQKALKTVESLVKKYPDCTEARIWKIRLLISLEKFEEAESLLVREIGLNGSDWRVYHLYSLLAEKMGLLDERLVMCSKAQKYLEEGRKIYVEAADAWLKLGMRTKALGCLEKAMAMNPADKSVSDFMRFIENGEDL